MSPEGLRTPEFAENVAYGVQLLRFAASYVATAPGSVTMVAQGGLEKCLKDILRHCCKFIRDVFGVPETLEGGSQQRGSREKPSAAPKQPLLLDMSIALCREMLKLGQVGACHLPPSLPSLRFT